MDKEKINVIGLKSRQTSIKLLDQLIRRIRMIFGHQEDALAGIRIVAEPSTKDERESGAAKLPIIGNGKEWSNEDRSRQKMHGGEARTTRNIPRAQAQAQEGDGWTADNDDTQIPF